MAGLRNGHAHVFTRSLQSKATNVSLGLVMYKLSSSFKNILCELYLSTIRIIRYSLFATIRCSLFATIRFSLFGFSRHPESCRGISSSKLNVYDSAAISLKKICKNIPVVQKMRHDRMVSFLRFSDHIFVSIIVN